MQLKIKKEFKELIPDLSAEEFKQLEDNCINDGIRDKLIIWEDYIIDGHNRFEIAGKHNLKFQTEEIAFDNEDEAKIFIINLQLGRRNLVGFVKIELMQERKEILLKKGKEKMSEGGKGLSIIGEPSHNTQKQLAKELKIGTNKLAQAEIVIKKATPEVKQKLRSGEISINNAYQDIKKNEKRNEVYKKEIITILLKQNFKLKFYQKTDFFPEIAPSKFQNLLNNIFPITNILDKIINKSPLNIFSHHHFIILKKN